MMPLTLQSCLIVLTTEERLPFYFRNVFAYRVTLEHFRMTEVMVGLTSSPLYEVENSSYLGEIMATGMSALYGSFLNVKHYAIKTAEHIVDILTSETYIIE